MTEPDNVESRLTLDSAELAAAAELVYNSIPELDRDSVDAWFSAGHAEQLTTWWRSES